MSKANCEGTTCTHVSSLVKLCLAKRSSCPKLLGLNPQDPHRYCVPATSQLSQPPLPGKQPAVPTTVPDPSAWTLQHDHLGTVRKRRKSLPYTGTYAIRSDIAWDSTPAVPTTVSRPRAHIPSFKHSPAPLNSAGTLRTLQARASRTSARCVPVRRGGGKKISVQIVGEGDKT